MNRKKVPEAARRSLKSVPSGGGEQSTVGRICETGECCPVVMNGVIGASDNDELTAVK